MHTDIFAVLRNDTLWVSVFAMITAQFLKPFIHYLRLREFDWHHMAETGGMPSSHSALVCAIATGVGYELGFDSIYFAMSVALAMIVTYDAAGVRRQAGTHARILNEIVAELLSGHPISEEQLQEVLGHSRLEVLAGIVFGAGIMTLWKLSVSPLFG